jgi:hypothetical protein
LARQQRGDNRAGQASQQQLLLLRAQAVRKNYGESRRAEGDERRSQSGSALNPRWVDVRVA